MSRHGAPRPNSVAALTGRSEALRRAEFSERRRRRIARPELEPVEDRVLMTAVGQLDPTFGAGGSVPIASNNGALSMTVDSQGRILIADVAHYAGNGNWARNDSTAPPAKTIKIKAEIGFM